MFLIFVKRDLGECCDVRVCSLLRLVLPLELQLSYNSNSFLKKKKVIIFQCIFLYIVLFWSSIIKMLLKIDFSLTFYIFAWLILACCFPFLSIFTIFMLYPQAMLLLQIKVKSFVDFIIIQQLNADLKKGEIQNYI